MSQISFADAEYAGRRKKTRREVFLEFTVVWLGGAGHVDRCPLGSRLHVLRAFS